jgi:peroxiredoxin Q/BCP
MYGKKYMGTERSTFVIDGAGRIADIFRKVKPEEHVGLVRAALEKLAAK